MKRMFIVIGGILAFSGTQAFAQERNHIELPSKVILYCADTNKINLVSDQLEQMERTSETLIKNLPESLGIKADDLRLDANANPMSDGMIQISITLTGRRIGKVEKYVLSQLRAGAISSPNRSVLVGVEGCAVAQ